MNKLDIPNGWVQIAFYEAVELASKHLSKKEVSQGRSRYFTPGGRHFMTEFKGGRYFIDPKARTLQGSEMN